MIVLNKEIVILYFLCCSISVNTFIFSDVQIYIEWIGKAGL